MLNDQLLVCSLTEVSWSIKFLSDLVANHVYYCTKNYIYKSIIKEHVEYFSIPDDSPLPPPTLKEFTIAVLCDPMEIYIQSDVSGCQL